MYFLFFDFIFQYLYKDILYNIKNKMYIICKIIYIINNNNNNLKKMKSYKEGTHSRNYVSARESTKL